MRKHQYSLPPKHRSHISPSLKCHVVGHVRRWLWQVSTVGILACRQATSTEGEKKAIENLPDDFRLVAVLSFLEGFSYQEIAEIADLQLGTVKSRLHRGRKLLQRQLFDYAVKNGYIKEKAK